MASFVKSKLKAARDAIGKKDYTLARDAASQVLDYEAENYNALLQRKAREGVKIFVIV
ncbi:hypothetical protein HWV62_24268 [Athelia sp. TMB]|nr:hypothetical protein HWV62_24268 [Athelia sp. TMB]